MRALRMEFVGGFAGASMAGKSRRFMRPWCRGKHEKSGGTAGAPRRARC
jgi:hypothetical protein